MNFVLNSQKYPYLGYCGMGVQKSQKLRAGIKILYPYPGIVARSYITHRGSGVGYFFAVQSLQKSPARGMNVVQNSQKFFVG